jgi:hypothetical protein
MPIRGAVLFALLAAWAGPVDAADLALSVQGGWADMTNAAHSAEAVFGSRGGATAGLRVDLGLGGPWFAGAGLRYVERDGERVFTEGPGAPVFRLGHPLSVRIVPVFVAGGYRFRRDSRLVPYALVGGGVASLRETSTVAEVKDTSTRTKGLALLAAGVEYGRGTVRAGAEISYSRLPDAGGLGGVTAAYGETDLGGLGLVATVVVRP